MGRGRAKAKQTKVARELKYSSPSTDYTALQRELAGGKGALPSVAPIAKDDPELEDDLTDELDDELEEDDEQYGGWVSSR